MKNISLKKNKLFLIVQERVNLLSGMSDSDDSDWDEHVPRMLDKRLNEGIPSTSGQYKSSFTVSTTTSGKRVVDFDCTFERILALPGGDENLWRTSPRKRVRTDRTVGYLYLNSSLPFALFPGDFF